MKGPGLVAGGDQACSNDRYAIVAQAARGYPFMVHAPCSLEPWWLLAFDFPGQEHQEQESPQLVKPFIGLASLWDQSCKDGGASGSVVLSSGTSFIHDNQ